MTRTISLITATVGAALLFAVPAWGDNWRADELNAAKQDAQLVSAQGPDWFERAAAAAIRDSRLPFVDARSDALNRHYGLGEYANTRDAYQKVPVVSKVVAPQPPGFDARSDGLNRLYGLGEYASPVVGDSDRFRIDHSNTPVTVSATSTGRDIQWPTIGIGFGIGLVLLLGIGLAMKATHTRPFAH